jgi:Transcriptional regulators
MPKPLDSLLQDLLVTAHRLTRIAAQSTGSTTPSAVWHTLAILTSEGPLRVGDLARVARVTQPSMTKLVQQLVEDDLVRRDADAEDSRAWLISIGPKGIAALQDWRAELGRTLSPMFGDLKADDIVTLERAIEILRTRTRTRAALRTA